MVFRMGGRRTRQALAVLAVGLLAVVVPGTALAAGGGATVVRGIQHEFGSCQIDGVDGYLMDGSLTGCWIVDTFEVKPMPVQGTMLAHGTEHFVGYLGGAFGTFRTTYTYTARFDGATELHGRCHHPIVGRHRGLRRRARRAELHRRGRRRSRLLSVLGQHPARPQGRVAQRHQVGVDLGSPGRVVVAGRDCRSGGRRHTALLALADRPDRCRRSRQAAGGRGTIAAYFRRYAAGVMPVARRNSRRKNVGSS